MKNNIHEITIPAAVQTYQEPLSGARTAAFPFSFPDGVQGVIMVTRIDRKPWKPYDSISKLLIHWHD